MDRGRGKGGQVEWVSREGGQVGWVNGEGVGYRWGGCKGRNGVGVAEKTRMVLL